MEEETEGTKAIFNAWLESELEKRNSSLISDDKYKCLLDNIKHNCGTRTIKKRQQRHKYQILNYPNLNLNEILCSPSSSVSEFHLLYYQFLDGFH